MMQKISTEKNGTKEEPLPDSDICPNCKNTGWEYYTKDGYEFAKECACGILKKQILSSRRRFADIPEAFRDMSLNTFRLDVYETEHGKKIASSACKAIKYWIDNLESMEERGMGLYIYSGTKGSGKTRMVASIANELMLKKNMQVKFATSMQVLTEIKSSWDKNENYTESSLLDFLSTTEILILDDFGTEQVKEWIGERFYQIINNRYVDKKITIFTSNISIEKLKYDSRISNRIKERTFQIPFPEESVREHIARKNAEELLRGIQSC